MYGAMIWPLYSAKAQAVFNTWSTCVKLAWGVPRATHTYLLDNLLSGGIPSMRSNVLARYYTFYTSLMRSSSLAVRVLANICSHNVRSSTGSLRRKQDEYSRSIPGPCKGCTISTQDSGSHGGQVENWMSQEVSCREVSP